jgi:hypothetical protein
MKKRYLLWLVGGFALLLAVAQQNNRPSPFDEIAKHIAAGDAEALAGYFSHTVECDLLGEEHHYSQTQAMMVMKSFFEKQVPKTFSFKHSSEKQTVRYAIGVLRTQADDSLRITVFTKQEDDKMKIQQLRIEKN